MTRGALLRRAWTPALALLLLAQLAWFLVYTDQIVRSLHENAATMTRMFAEVQAGITSEDPDAMFESLMSLQQRIVDAGVPLALTDSAGRAIAQVNLPFEADLSTDEGQVRIQAWLALLDVDHPPIRDFSGNLIHYGDPPQTARLRWIPWLQAGGLILTLMIGLSLIRAQRRAEAERAWTSMARELAHQLGTPLSSLQGWLELLRMPQEERPGGISAPDIGDAIEEDLERLERVSRRFELIGRESKLEPVALPELFDELERYIQARLPRLGPGIRFVVSVPDDLPAINGTRVLLVWALENVVKNSLDALAGSGGTIEVTAQAGEGRWVDVRIADDGPGVPLEVRDRIFEPGVTTKAGGWGVGLALSRRIVEGVHGGRIQLLDTPQRGAVFLVKLPRSGG
ncbi:MAG: HAMP domain-containing sensor histidine kinase [Gemmatimonadota bacterium]|nr:HAMP domain-containing histidine kinase [Gemmatimonadota bacterium]